MVFNFLGEQILIFIAWLYERNRSSGNYSNFSYMLRGQVSSHANIYVSMSLPSCDCDHKEDV
jgi:hypothetical protein